MTVILPGYVVKVVGEGSPVVGDIVLVVVSARVDLAFVCDVFVLIAIEVVLSGPSAPVRHGR